MFCTVLLISAKYQNLKDCLSQIKGINNVIFAEDVLTAEQLIGQTQPDIIVSEIELFNQSNAASCLQQCQEKELIFISSNSSLAVAAFELNASDFILAPFSFDRLKTVVEKTVKNLQQRNSRYADISERLFNKERFTFLDTRIMLREVGRVRFFNQKDIKYIKGAGGNYIEIHFEDGNKLLHRETLSNIESNLNGNIFKRVHRSIIVNIEYVQEITSLKTGGVAVKLINGDQLTVGRQKKALIDSILVNL